MYRSIQLSRPTFESSVDRRLPPLSHSSENNLRIYYPTISQDQLCKTKLRLRSFYCATRIELSLCIPNKFNSIPSLPHSEQTNTPSPCLPISSHAKIESRLDQRKKKGRGGREKEMKDLDPFLSYLLSRSSTTRFGSHFVLVTSPNLAATFSCLLLPVRRIMKIRRRRAEPSRIIVAVFLRRIISAAIRRPRRGLGREEGKEGRRGRSLSRHDPPTHARTQFSTTFQPPLIDIPIAISVGIISRCR